MKCSRFVFSLLLAAVSSNGIPSGFGPNSLGIAAVVVPQLPTCLNKSALPQWIGWDQTPVVSNPEAGRSFAPLDELGTNALLGNPQVGDTGDRYGALSPDDGVTEDLALYADEYDLVGSELDGDQDAYLSAISPNEEPYEEYYGDGYENSVDYSYDDYSYDDESYDDYSYDDYGCDDESYDGYEYGDEDWSTGNHGYAESDFSAGYDDYDPYTASDEAAGDYEEALGSVTNGVEYSDDAWYEDTWYDPDSDEESEVSVEDSSSADYGDDSYEMEDYGQYDRYDDGYGDAYPYEDAWGDAEFDRAGDDEDCDWYCDGYEDASIEGADDWYGDELRHNHFEPSGTLRQWSLDALLTDDDRDFLRELAGLLENTPERRRLALNDYLERLGWDAIRLMHLADTRLGSDVLDLSHDPLSVAALLGCFRLCEFGDVGVEEAVELLAESQTDMPPTWGSELHAIIQAEAGFVPVAAAKPTESTHRGLTELAQDYWCSIATAVRDTVLRIRHVALDLASRPAGLMRSKSYRAARRTHPTL